MIVGIVFYFLGDQFMSRILDGYPSNYNFSGFCVECTFAKVHFVFKFLLILVDINNFADQWKPHLFQ